MDAFTLSATICLAAAIMAASFLALYLAHAEQRCLRDWAFAGGLFFANSALALLLFGGKPPYWLAPAFINTLLVAAYASLLVGLRRYLGLRPGWPLLGVLALLVFSAHGLPWMRQSVEHRLMLLWPSLMAINLAMLWTMWRSPGFGWRSEFVPLAALQLFNVLQHALRLVLVLSGQAQELTLMGSNFLQTSGQLALLFFILLSGMGCAFVVIVGQARQLRALAERDAMTGWRNRRSLEQSMTPEQARARRLQQPFALILFDIDHFKRINDHHGHEIGDRAICHVTQLVADELRDYDGRFRIGGEEFLVLIPAEAAAHAPAIAERLRRRVEQTPLGELLITVSVGCARFRPAAEDWQSTLKRADEALYAAKRSGRNRSLAHEDLSADGEPHAQPA
ncbi:diguanylate cyclase [Inhella sp.]|uniref:GGDEF domain-containing protein n=1 Tax=Inhella sp. TaxID=1921806 RepID=UPI0035AFF967